MDASNSTTPKLKVAICGGGVSGLFLAVALSRCAGIQVDVYEAADQFKEIGAGIMIWARTWWILESLGLGPAFSKIAHAPPDGSIETGFNFRRSDQAQEGFCFQMVRMPYGCVRFYRVSFLDVFIDALPENVAHFGTRLVSYSQEIGRGVNLSFADGSTATCDIFVGCDGIKSCIRGQLFREVSERSGNSDLLKFVDPVWTGTIAYRGLIPVERLPPHHRSIVEPMMYCGKSKSLLQHVVSYSISAGSVVNVVTFASEPQNEGKPYKEDTWVSHCPQQELLDCYAHWEPEVEQLLSQIENPTKWFIHHLRPLPFYVDGNVALLGDACHGMAPHEGIYAEYCTGAGAGQAIEDAYILASLLEQVSKETLPIQSTLPCALKAYEVIRLPFANHVLQGSYDSGLMYEFDNAEYGDNYEVLGPAIEKQWHWVEDPSPQVERLRALECFKDLIS
ncbi:FAD/NAD-binding domain-containing protein [Rhodocollybia butyracea]|uniref:FAD/NAD-binding domain-containing protein n=1 Tax=Rhodocollybia butyracea TaxID=206335 RepID=A0A9P5U7N6_9AGAR|nr:FAD/NAD-binding domain-containing protein [Rhodocollybia butyracea]